jgi:hypothetical protein
VDKKRGKRDGLYRNYKGPGYRPEIKTNSLRSYRTNKLTQCDEATHKKICDRILHNENEYLIFPTEIDRLYFQKPEKNGP